MGNRRSVPQEKTEFHLSEADKAHRRDFARFAQNHSEDWYRPRLERLYQRWNQWNEDFFGKKMTEPYLMISSLTGKGTMGLYQDISSFGGKSVIRINRTILTGEFPSCANGNKNLEGLMRIAEDTLLHEMIHQYASEHLFEPEPSQRGHGVVFRDECNRIAAQIGWEGEVRISKKTKTNAHLPSCAQWPDGIRPDPEGYYLGAWNPQTNPPSIHIVVREQDNNPNEAFEEAVLQEGPTNSPEPEGNQLTPKDWKILFNELGALTGKAQNVIAKLANLHGVEFQPS